LGNLVVKSEEELTRAYLLGLLDGPDRESVEDRLFADDSYLDQIEDQEDQLIEQYLRRELTAKERSAFEAHFLSSARRRRRMEVTQALVRIAGALNKPERHASPSYWWSALFHQQFALTALAIAILSTGLTGWLAVRLVQERNIAAARQREWSIERQQTTDKIAQLQGAQAARSATVFALTLAPGLLRGQTERVLRIPVAAGTVQLNLQTQAALPGPHYTATLHREAGGDIWRSDDVRREGTRQAMVLVPAEMLSAGRYLLTLSAPGKTGPGGVIDDYAFGVTRE
jgi:hypothetical protein